LQYVQKRKSKERKQNESSLSNISKIKPDQEEATSARGKKRINTTEIAKKIDLKPQHLYPHYHDKTFFKAAMEYGMGPIHSARSTSN